LDINATKAYALFSTREQFQNELKRFIRRTHAAKALIQRLVKAGIWKEE